MYVVLSPAKKLNEGPCLDHVGHTQLDLSSEVQELMGVTKPLKREQLRQLMGISESLAELNVSAAQRARRGILQPVRRQACLGRVERRREAQDQRAQAAASQHRRLVRTALWPTIRE